MGSDILSEVITAERRIQERLDAEKRKSLLLISEAVKEAEEEIGREEGKLRRALSEAIEEARKNAEKEADAIRDKALGLSRRLAGMEDRRLREILRVHLTKLLP